MVTGFLLAAALTAATCDCPYENVDLVGHRGSGSSTLTNPFAENTLPSVRNAYEEGAEYVEIDVQLSSDGEVVLFHDYELDDLTDLDGCVANTPYSTMKDADATKGSGATEVVGIPLLSEALAITVEYQRILNIEIKVNETAGECPATDVEALVDAVLAVVEAENAGEHVFLSSFSFDALAFAKQRNAAIPVGFLVSDVDEAALIASAKRAAEAGFEALNPLNLSLSLNPEYFDAIDAAAEIKVIPWTVNQRDALVTMYEGGADAIITDEVPLAIEVRDELCEAYVCPAPAAGGESDSGGCASAPGSLPLSLLAAMGLLWLRRRVQ